MAFVTYPCDIKPNEVTAFFNVVCFHKSIFISSAFIAAYPTLLLSAVLMRLSGSSSLITIF